MPDRALLVLTMLPRDADVEAIARSLLERRLAACVQIGAPVRSLYHWKGEIETGEEVPLSIKTRAVLYPDLERALRELHPYELPEIVGVPLTHGSAGYLQWIDEATRRR